MQLQLKPGRQGGGKPCGILIRGSEPETWLQAIKGTGISLAATEAYAIPGAAAASVWGCLLITEVAKLKDLPPSATFVQAVAGKLFIPLHATLYPTLSDSELAALLKDGRYLMHSETGLALLEERVNWSALIEEPAERPVKVSTPASPVFLPETIRRFELAATSPEEGVQELEQRIVPEQKKFSDKPLNPVERIKLSLYKQLFSKSAAGKGERGGLLQKLEALIGASLPGLDRMQEDFEDLERRNSSEIDKLLKMLKDNPEEALKYAVPLGDGTGRGGPGAIRLSKRWNGFSLFGNAGSSGGGGVISDNHQTRLFREYTKTAEDLLSKGEYEKAAFVYLKLLKNYSAAAQALEKGGLYAEAAAVHLKYTNNKSAAADCYVKAAMLSKAIELYTELGADETVGDLYMRLNWHGEAMSAYGRVVDKHISANRVVKAAGLTRDKMGDMAGAQELLLSGWRSGRDAYNCLHIYFSNIADTGALRRTIDTVYATDVSDGNASHFLSALKGEVGRDENLDLHLRAMAIEIISSKAASEPAIVYELRAFNKENALIGKDIIRYRTVTRQYKG